MTVLKTVLLDIPADKQEKRGWKVTLDGGEVREVRRLTIENPKFGVLEYGNDPAGYDRWGYHEIGGGGSVIIPYACIDLNYYIGVLAQNRVNQGGKVRNVPRGFLKPGETHFQAARRELLEETSFVPQGQDVVLLEGRPMNPNSAYFETTEDGEGVKVFGLRVNPEVLVPRGLHAYDFKPGVLQADPASKSAKLVEQILDCTFISWIEAVELSDMFTVAAIGRLMAMIYKSK